RIADVRGTVSVSVSRASFCRATLRSDFCLLYSAFCNRPSLHCPFFPEKDDGTGDKDGRVDTGKKTNKQRKGKGPDNSTPQGKKRQEHHDRRTGRDNRPAQGLVDAHVDNTFQAFAADLSHVFADAITDDNCIVDRESDNGKKSRDDREIEFVMAQHESADCDQHIMDQRDNRSYAKAKLEAEPDVNSHHNRRSDHRPSPPLAQFLAHLRSHRLNPPYFKPARTKLFGEARAKLLAQGTDLNRGSFQANEELVGTLPSELLDHTVSGPQFPQCSAHLANRHLLHKFELHNGSTGKVDAEARTLGKQQDQD